jgi:hypothetical protein
VATKNIIENVLTQSMDNVKKFEEIEGFNSDLVVAIVKLIRNSSKATDEEKVTENCRVAWSMLSDKNKAILEEHLGRKNIAHFLLALKIMSKGENISGFFRQFMGGEL